MASLVLSGDTSGSITVSAPAVAGSNTQTLVATTGTLAPIVSGTAITLTNQTAPEFTGIPSWAKRITLQFAGVSTNSTGVILIQIGSSTYTTSGYIGGAYLFINTPGIAVSSISSGFAIETSSGSLTASTIRHGLVTLTLQTGNTWVASGFLGHTGTNTGGAVGGYVALSGTLDRVRLYIDGTQQFDAGTINILYE